MMSPAPYDAIAAWYDAFVRDETHAGNFGLPYLMQLIGDVRGQMICDLACGQGRVARMLAYLGARVVGVDISSELLTMARAEEGQTPLEIDYVLDDAQAIASIADEQFDGVVCNLGLTDVPELSATFQAVNRVLRRSGWFVFCIPHPCFEPPHADWLDTTQGQRTRVIKQYFGEGYWRSENVHGLRAKVGAYHRMLSTYLNGLVEAGFAVKRVLEPQADEATVAREGGYGVVPTLLLVRSVKMDTTRQ